MDVIKMKELVWKGAHNGLANSQVPNQLLYKIKDETILTPMVYVENSVTMRVIRNHLQNTIPIFLNHLLKCPLHNLWAQGPGLGKLNLKGENSIVNPHDIVKEDRLEIHNEARAYHA